MTYLSNNVPIMPGAYLINGTDTSVRVLSHLPIFSSIPSLTGMGFDDVDNYYYVLPGYKVERYKNNNYDIINGNVIDNTNGTKIMIYQQNTAGITDNTNSIKLYYNNIEIPSVYTYTPYANNSGSLTTTSISSFTRGSYIFNDMPIFPGAYLIDAIGRGCLPLYFSSPDINVTFFANTGSTASTGDRDDAVLVMPGYKIILWADPNYTGTYVAIDNTAGSTIIVGQSNGISGITTGWTPNTTTSVQLFYNGNIINQSDIVL